MRILTITLIVFLVSACRVEKTEVDTPDGRTSTTVTKVDTAEAARKTGTALEHAAEVTESAAREAAQKTGTALEHAAEVTESAAREAAQKTGTALEKAGKKIQEHSKRGDQ